MNSNEIHAPVIKLRVLFQQKIDAIWKECLETSQSTKIKQFNLIFDNYLKNYEIKDISDVQISGIYEISPKLDFLIRVQKPTSKINKYAGSLLLNCPQVAWVHLVIPKELAFRALVLGYFP